MKQIHSFTPQTDDESAIQTTFSTKLAGEDILLDVQNATPIGMYTNIIADTLIKTGRGAMIGFYVNSTTAGSIKFWDSLTATGTAITGTITPAVGWHPLPIGFTIGCFADITGTIDLTIVTI